MSNQNQINIGRAITMVRKEPKSVIKSINDISDADIQEMHHIFIKYYNHTDLNTFTRDIRNKQYVLLITHPVSGIIVGFTTIAIINLTYKRKNVLGLFSGDTILEKEFWGSRRWQLTWVWFCLKLKVMNFRVPFFWLLISKGYKTYLLMANNFNHYYPRLDREDEQLADIVDLYCEQLFPGQYIKELRILDFGDKYQSLQSHVAEISSHLKENHPKIKYFEELNPDWRRGTELPCVGVINIPVVISFAKKVIAEKFKVSRNVFASSKIHTG
jgi:hypothetical protein